MAILKKLLGKKKEEEDTSGQIGDGVGGAQPAAEEKKEEAAEEQPAISEKNLSLPLLKAELEKLSIQFGSFKEIRGAFSERFTRVSEQIGELRAMLLDRDREFGQLQAKALKAIDTVEAVKPDKITINLQKQDGKIEALQATIDSNDAIMQRISQELRDLRNKLQVFAGLEKVGKMGEEVKQEIIEIKKMEAMAQSHADKVEVMFVEMQKRFKELEQYNDRLNELTLDAKQRAKSIDLLTAKAAEAASKAELEKEINALKKKIDESVKTAPAVTEDGKEEHPKELKKDLKSLRFMVKTK